MDRARLGRSSKFIHPSGLGPDFSPDGTTLVFEDSAYGTADIFTMSSTGANVSRLADTGGWDQDPKYSYDGTQVAFSKLVFDSVGAVHYYDIYIVNTDGTGLRALTNDQAWARHNHGPAFSPDGTRVAFTRTTRPPDPAGYKSEVYVTNSDGSGSPARLTTEGGANPTYSPDGSKIFYGGEVNGVQGIYSMNTDGSGKALVSRLGGAPSFSSSGDTIAFNYTQNYNALLNKYSPTLVYDQQETYRADAVNTITDNYVSGQYTNYLKRSSTILAVSNPAYPKPDLKLAFLGSPRYSNNTTAQTGDNLDEANSYAVDAQRMHGNPSYADRIYGRVKTYPNGEAVLQYWLWYYYNSKSFLGIGVHEGDWEMVQVHLDPLGMPTAMAAAQHGGGERCDWANVQRGANDRPRVYVGDASHASYFSPGDHFFDAGAAVDNADGEGGTVTPSVVNITTSPSWRNWGGRWGGSTGSGGGSASPQGPGHDENAAKYSDPLLWGSIISGCTEGQTQALGALSRRTRNRGQARGMQATPPVPALVARRRGGRVIVSYRFAKWSSKARRRPQDLVVSVDASGERYPPLTVRRSIHTSSAKLRLPLGAGRGPFRLLVSTEMASGASSRTVSTKVR